MTNSYFIYRMTRALVKINMFITAALLIDVDIWTMHLLCLVFVSFFAIQAARESAFLYYGMMILWEFLVLPAGETRRSSRWHACDCEKQKWPCTREQEGERANTRGMQECESVMIVAHEEMRARGTGNALRFSMCSVLRPTTACRF